MSIQDYRWLLSYLSKDNLKPIDKLCRISKIVFETVLHRSESSCSLARLGEMVGFIGTLQKQLTNNCQTSLAPINADLATNDKQIDELIEQHDRLKELFAWPSLWHPGAVPGVGSALKETKGRKKWYALEM